MTWIFILRPLAGRPVQLAVSRLRQALARQSIDCRWLPGISQQPLLANQADPLILLGCQNEPPLGPLIGSPLTAAESYTNGRTGDGLRYLAGSDATGLSYGLTELAERIDEQGEPVLREWAECTGKPHCAVRGIDRFISNRDDASWWMNPDWRRFYLEMLQQSRFNRLTLVVGFDTAYLSPPYPFFTAVPGFPEVTLQPWYVQQRELALAALRDTVQSCHDMGLHFCLAIWQQIPWQSEQDQLVEGLTEENISDYCAAGLTALLEACPTIDTIQFRVNHESGVGSEDSAVAFWLAQFDALAAFNQRQQRDIHLEIRAKGMTDSMLSHAQSLGLSVMVSTKYCCEQAGLPHHLTQMRAEERRNPGNLNLSRRYSYDDLLRRPRAFPLIYRLWQNGSSNLLLWADPDYARRFIDSLRLGPAAGFEVMPPLSYRGGHELIRSTGWPLLTDARLRPPAFDDERYWPFYWIYGRTGYDPAAAGSSFTRRMNLRHGPAGPALSRLLFQASRVLPLLTAVHFPAHPQLQFWTEMGTGGALFAEHNHNTVFRQLGITYQDTPGCDEGLFSGIRESAACQAGAAPDGRYNSRQQMGWLSRVLQELRQARHTAAAKLTDADDLQDDPYGWERRGIFLDAELLESLGTYHLWKMKAAFNYSLYQQTGHGERLARACADLQQALSAWRRLAARGSSYYHDLLFSVGAQTVRRGHWQDFIPEIEADLGRLEQLLEADHPAISTTYSQDGENRPVQTDDALDDLPEPAAPDWQAIVPEQHGAGRDLSVVLSAGNLDSRRPPRLRWRRTCQADGPFAELVMQHDGDVWRATVPGSAITPQWDLLLYFMAEDEAGNGLIYPGIWHSGLLQPYYLIRITAGESEMIK